MPLKGARILVTRPAHQAQELCRQIEAAGGTALRLPLFKIVATAQDQILRPQLLAAMDADWWLFSSANAARAATTLCPPPWRPAVAAVGAATEAVLRGEGLSDVTVPESGYSGAALLQLEPFLAPEGLKCVIVAGEEGRTELADTLILRGARVETIALYRREPIEHPMEEVAACIRASDAIVLTSADGASRLVELTADVMRDTLQRKTVLVPSARVAEKVRELGFTVPPLLPQQIADSAMVIALADWWRTRKPAP
jgi:uroporphyrinogen-III synthase